MSGVVRCLLMYSRNVFYENVAGLRFFTVYGPWGRPDMSAMTFARSIVDGKIIRVFKVRDYVVPKRVRGEARAILNGVRRNIYQSANAAKLG